MIHVLTGPVRRGKTTLLKKMWRRVKQRGPVMEGFLSESVEEGEFIAGYDLFDLQNETRVPFLRRQGGAGWQKTGPYYMIPEALDRASALIRRAEPGRLLVVDEVGPLELGGAGFWPALAETVFRADIRSLLVVRDSCLEDFLRKPGAGGARIFSVGDPEVKDRLFREVFIAGPKSGRPAEAEPGSAAKDFRPPGKSGGRELSKP